MNLIVTGVGVDEPQTHYGPGRAPEWPSSTLDPLLSRTLDEHRKDYEHRIDRLNASATDRYKVFREVPVAKAAESSGDDAEPTDGTSPRERLSGNTLEGLRPAEPPLAF